MTKRNPKVLVVATSRKTRGGITSVVKALEQTSLWDKFHCHWVQTHRDGNAAVKIGYLASALLDFVLRLPFYDIVHIHFSMYNSMRRKAVFSKIAKMFGRKVILHFHACNTADSIDGQFREQYRRLFESSDKIIVLSQWWKDEIRRAFRELETDIGIVYNPCQKVAESSVPSQKQILYAGSVIPRKGYADLIRAFAKIADAAPGWTLKIAGNGEIEQARLLAEELGIAYRMLFPGWIAGKDKDRAFREASVFCLPSYDEGFPMAVLDAWSYGLPVVTTPVGGIPDVAEDGKNMLLFAPGDVDALAAQLLRLINDAELRKKLERESERMANGRFSIDETCRRIEDTYMRVM